LLLVGEFKNFLAINIILANKDSIPDYGKIKDSQLSEILLNAFV